MPACCNDRAGVGGQNRRAVGSTDVRAAVAVAHPAADILVARHRPDEGTRADLGDHAVFELGTCDGDFRRGGLQHIIGHSLAISDRTVDHRGFVGDFFRAVHALLHGHDLAEIVLIGLGVLGVKGNCHGLGVAADDLDLDKLCRGCAGRNDGALGNFLVK